MSRGQNRMRFRKIMDKKTPGEFALPENKNRKAVRKIVKKSSGWFIAPEDFFIQAYTGILISPKGIDC